MFSHETRLPIRPKTLIQAVVFIYFVLRRGYNHDDTPSYVADLEPDFVNLFQEKYTKNPEGFKLNKNDPTHIYNKHEFFELP